MSERGDLNFESPGQPSRDAERVLDRLVPQPLEVSRDELFFQAGYAAGCRGRATSYFWPSYAAALLLVCIGLAATLVAQRPTIGPEGRTVASENSRKAPAERDEVVDRNPQSPMESFQFSGSDRLRDWRRLASPGRLLPGHLTAMGWTELSPRDRAQSGAADRESDSSALRRPSTYLELMRQQEEG